MNAIEKIANEPFVIYGCRGNKYDTCNKSAITYKLREVSSEVTLKQFIMECGNCGKTEVTVFKRACQ